jgi:outer membrane protein, multidrug efflux system
VVIKQKRHFKFFLNVCVVYATVFIMISGCNHDDKPQIPFQTIIDTEKSPYQFSARSFILSDIQFLKKNNLDLNIAQSRINQSQALYRQAYAGYLPQISADMSTTHQEGANPFAMRPQINRDFYSVHGNVSFIPDFFGKTHLRTSIANNQIQTTYFQAQSTYLNILNGYAKNYHLVCSTKALIHINQDTVKTNQNIVKSLKIRYELGRSNSVDYYNARDVLIESQIALDKAHQNYNLARQSYYSLIGKPLDNTSEEAMCSRGFSKLPTKKIAMRLDALDKRPDIKVLEYTLRSSVNALDLSLKALYPDADLLFTVQNSALLISDIFDINRFASSLTARLTALVYDGGRRNAQIDISRADFKIAQKTYHNSIITAANQLITLGKNLNLSIKLEDDATHRLTIATKARDAASRHYQLGTIDFTQFINSQRTYYAAQLGLVSVQQNTRNLYTDLLTASGIAPIGTL